MDDERFVNHMLPDYAWDVFPMATVQQNGRKSCRHIHGCRRFTICREFGYCAATASESANTDTLVVASVHRLVVHAQCGNVVAQSEYFTSHDSVSEQAVHAGEREVVLRRVVRNAIRHCIHSFADTKYLQHWAAWRHRAVYMDSRAQVAPNWRYVRATCANSVGKRDFVYREWVHGLVTHTGKFSDYVVCRAEGIRI